MSQPIYLVSGLPRSGTSLMMQMLSRGGLSPLTDELRAADEDNPRGYYELERVKQPGHDWLPDARGRVVKLISRLLVELPVGGPYKVVFMRRELDEVLRSQRAMLERRGERDELDRDDDAMKQLYVAHLEDVEGWLRRRGEGEGADVSALFVSYNRLVQDPRRQAARVHAFLADAALDVDAMVGAVDPALYRNRRALGRFVRV